MAWPKGKRKPKTGGRKKGSKNKLPGVLKTMILEALDEAGGVTYLAHQATANVSAFCSLLGRVLPTEVHGPGEEGEHKVTVSLKW